MLAKSCLEANIAEAKLHTVLRSTMCERATLAFSLINNASNTIKQEEVKAVLRLAFNALMVPELTFFEALAEGLYDLSRPLMGVILICLKCLQNSRDRSAVSASLLDIFEAIGAKAASNLFHRARSNPSADTADMVNISIAISQEIISLSTKDGLPLELSSKLMDHNSVDAAVRLYATSHQALVDEQPIFAELSLHYLAALCSLPQVPEQIAVAGIFSFFMESPVSSILQSSDIRAPQNISLHRLWTRGVLPIIFNLLQSLASRITRDTVAFLRLYENQIQGAFTEWARPKFVTTALVDETTLLLVLFEVVDNLLQLEQDRFIFKGKEDLLENVNNLLAHPRFLARLVHPTSLEEEQLTEQKEGEFKNGLVAKITSDLEEMRGLLTQ
jgi:nuclear pore complex protein Nup188